MTEPATTPPDEGKSIFVADNDQPRPSAPAATRSHAVDDVSFTLEEGAITTIVGESGSGKSTIARMVLGLLPVTSGTLTFDGQGRDHTCPARTGRRTGATSRRCSRTRSPRSTSSSPCAGC